MNRTVLMGLFIVVAAAQIAVPASMIVRREAVLEQGRLFRFRVQPVDPYDAFRGRYVSLSLAEDSGPVPAGSVWIAGQTVYAQLVEDSQGFAHIGRVTASEPDHPDYIAAKVRYVEGDRAFLDLFLDRYYTNENLAPEAESAYREHARAGVEDAYVAVRVRNGDAVIEGLYVAGERIEDFVRRQAGEQDPEDGVRGKARWGQPRMALG